MIMASSVIAFTDDLLSALLATLGPPFVRGAACPFLGEFAGGQLIASAEYIYCRVQRANVERFSSAPLDLERAVTQYRRGHVVYPSLCCSWSCGLAAVATARTSRAAP